MKKILTLGIAMMIVFAVSAQKNVTKFMGIPVDGTKAEMIQKLKAKGFTYNSTQDALTGKFNGVPVHLSFSVYHNKVYRILIIHGYSYPFTFMGMNNLKKEFNRFCKYFNDSKWYVNFNMPHAYIDDEEDIYSEIVRNDKNYTALFFQVTEADLYRNGDFDPKEKLPIVIKKNGNAYPLKKIEHKPIHIKILPFEGLCYIYIEYINTLNSPNDDSL